MACRTLATRVEAEHAATFRSACLTAAQLKSNSHEEPHEAMGFSLVIQYEIAYSEVKLFSS